MFKENQKTLNQLQIVIDIFVMSIAFSLAHYIRFYTSFFSEGILAIPLTQAFVPLLASIPIYLMFYNFMGLYQVRSYKLFEELKGVIKVNTYGIVTLILILFVFKIVDFSRLVLVTFYFLNIVFTFASRGVIISLVQNYRKKGYNLRKCLLIGYNDIGKQFIKNIGKNPAFGYKIVGILDDVTIKRRDLPAGCGIRGRIGELEDVLKNEAIDVVTIALTFNAYDCLGELIGLCEKHGIKTNIIPYYYQYIPARPYMDDLEGMPIIDTRHVPLDNLFKAIMKRLVDILISSVAIVLFSPIMLLSILMIKFTSPGPIIFKQERVGLNRKNFEMYKFRSMRVEDKSKEKHKWTTENDPRKTKWGNFMRKTSIDELPQFFNVLKGDMSVVGPRPERPYFVDQFKEKIPKYMIKHQVRPGITGWAQVNGWRGDTSIEKRIEFDLYYIENWTMSLDVKVILLTFVKGFVNGNAY
ncbi:undecaprenyl-phosphate glucose phosphotransferase [Fusibacter sp. 3D3]|uniref:undecaprenyl-phosphate glucose phosphotransferase n=1 Tax=Fusibacter sp. 3D3 TaxID=1048380 RepID=UPI0008535330|nr:undecaprenyl-phosphate glucose phosphotransferase [Fusibacter sp. 3D3]GAU77793.1 capsular polysaccharide biosynthesis protein [Fusibacter sp. 3D3]